jgi:hypothetical protein
MSNGSLSQVTAPPAARNPPADVGRGELGLTSALLIGLSLLLMAAGIALLQLSAQMPTSAASTLS